MSRLGQVCYKTSYYIAFNIFFFIIFSQLVLNIFDFASLIFLAILPLLLLHYILPRYDELFIKQQNTFHIMQNICVMSGKSTYAALQKTIMQPTRHKTYAQCSEYYTHII